jgi:uncharacterized protein (TIGR00106 family)
MILAELAIFPTSEGVSVSRYVKEMVYILEQSGIDTKTGAMATVLEASSLDDILRAVKKCHDALVHMGVKRIHVDLRIDHRLDKDATMKSKLKSIGKD